MTRIERMLISWYGDMNLLNHIYNIIRSGSFEVEVTFHNRIDISEKKSRKDIAENVMITDLVRNDLSITAIKGSVKVDDLCKVYTFKQVHQMVTSVSSEIPSNIDFTDVLRTMSVSYTHLTLPTKRIV